MRRLALALLLAVACTPEGGRGYDRALAEGERAESAGRFAEAAARYDEAAQAATRPRDRDRVEYAAALMLRRAGDARAAGLRFDSLASADPPGEEAAAAAFEAARMPWDRDPAEGWRAMDAVLRRFPDHGVARPALRHVLTELDALGGETRTLAYLQSLPPALTKSEVGEAIAYAIAVRLERLGRIAAARDALLAVAERWPYPEGALFDDALYRASELDERLGRAREAIADLEKMLSARESSWFMGSYERPLYDAAAMRIADLYEERLHDDARAKDALHHLYADFTTSLLRDRALWKEALLWDKDGDRDRGCERLATLVHDFPDSRYVPCAIERCPRVVRPDKSKAPATCHPYIRSGSAGGAPP